MHLNINLSEINSRFLFKAACNKSYYTTTQYFIQPQPIQLSTGLDSICPKQCVKDSSGIPARDITDSLTHRVTPRGVITEFRLFTSCAKP